ncbi:P-loop containing nucleoside triphosphate hydrolase protein, partial [Auriscalpium vulgare]
MDEPTLSSLPGFSTVQRAALSRGRLLTVSDVLFLSPPDLARKCRIPPQDAHAIVHVVCKALERVPQPLSTAESSETFTTGDAHLDRILGGGIRAGMVWEIVGEGAAGKTQLALQLSLVVQLPRARGGLAGSACYLTTASGLPTTRLVQLLREHPLLAGSAASLDGIHTLETKTIDTLLAALSSVLP